MSMIKILAGGAGLAAMAAAAPAAAQVYPYGYAQPYAYGYANPYAANPYAANATSMAASRCTAAVQQRLNARTRTGMNSIIGAIFGVNSAATGRVLNVTQVTPRRNTVRVSGLASSGRMAYNPYGYGYYGSVGAAYQPDLSFRCSVDYNGYVRDVDINRR
jgi:hypothetical protein